jgi:mono/diheme cytochrome c family protein
MRAWRAAGLASLLAIAGGASAGEPGLEVFTTGAQPPCAICHTLEAAGASGTLGPSLDELKPDEARIRTAVLNGVGAMPSFADQLSEEDIEAVVSFVARAVAGR